jgi:hypothetical protein
VDQADVVEVFVSGEAAWCQKVGEVKRCQRLSFGYREVESFAPWVVNSIASRATPVGPGSARGERDYVRELIFQNYRIIYLVKTD